MAALDDLERVHVDTRAQWRAWLRAHHASSPGVWLVTWRKGSDHPALSYDDIVEEALCFGWVDSRPGRVDAQRTRRLVTPRQAGSGWSALNKRRIERLEAAGLMAPAGRKAIEAAKRDGSWERLDHVEALTIPPDLAAAFRRHRGSAANFDAFPRFTKRAILEWIASAKKPGTRAKRVEETATLAARNERANQWKPPPR